MAYLLSEADRQRAADRFFRGLASILHPRPKLNIWQWAERNRILSKGVSSASKRAPVRYKTSLAPHQREPQEAVTDPDVQLSVWIMASQIGGKTEMGNNVVGYFMDHEPTNSVIMYPTIESAQKYSKKKLAPMITDTDCLNRIISPARTRDSGNTILTKDFLGGSIFLVGANSPAGLRQASGELLWADEIDTMEESAEKEGDPIELLWKRGESYPECVRVVSSTPTIAGASRIWDFFEESDQRYWFVPCPKCGTWQTMRWSQVKWPKGDPEKAEYICEKCDIGLTDRQRLDMYYGGEWRPTAQFRGVRGYHLNGIYCPWPAHRGYKNRLHEMAANWSRTCRDEEKHKVAINTFLCECYEVEAEKPPNASVIQNRAETYEELPAGLLCLTAGADLQDDRIECEIVGWGVGEECWAIEMGRFIGNPEEKAVWGRVEQFLTQKFTHPNGHRLTVACCCFDSGHKPKLVYSFAKRMYPMVYATKGASDQQAPLRSIPRKTTVSAARLIRIGTVTAKDHLYSRLKLDTVGPRYMHFRIGHGYDEEWYEQLVGEKRERRRKRGIEISEYIQTRSRNEAIDMRVGSLVALDILNPNWEALAKNLAKKVDTGDKSKAGPVRPPARRGGFVGSWRK